ncbi:MAG TPA: hypothetical protein PKE55_10055 [Kiritimatiellia bacterium]|nr:hypothetical protein [Kiritimatiellia bacterium]
MKRRWMNMSGLALALVVCVGCSDLSSSWYNKASSEKQKKEEYIQSMEAFGIDPREARADYEREIMIRKTEGREY